MAHQAPKTVRKAMPRGKGVSGARHAMDATVREWLSVEETRELLAEHGYPVGKNKIAKLLALGAEGGGLAYRRHPLDGRVKMIARADVERLLRGAS